MVVVDVVATERQTCCGCGNTLDYRSAYVRWCQQCRASIIVRRETWAWALIRRPEQLRGR